MEGVKNKVVLITGGASGIGLDAADRFLKGGAKVAIADLKEPDADFSGTSTETSDAYLFLQHDVGNERNWQKNLAKVVDHFGSLDVLVNSAGITIPGSPVDTPLEDWHKMFRVNVDGTFLGCKHAIPHLSEGQGGVIINLASVASFTPTSSVFGYGVTKAAIKMLSQSVAMYCRDKGNKVRCNTVLPGPILTPMTNDVLDVALGEGAHKKFSPGESSPFGVLGSAADIAKGILFLASDETGYANGTELMLDGGTTL